jgi:hypothetical protein
MPNQNFAVKLNWQEEGSAGTPKYCLQSKQHPRSWSTPIIWFGWVRLPSKQALVQLAWDNHSILLLVLSIDAVYQHPLFGI